MNICRTSLLLLLLASPWTLAAQGVPVPPATVLPSEAKTPANASAGTAPARPGSPAGFMAGVTYHIDAPPEMRATIKLYLDDQLKRVPGVRIIEHGARWEIVIVAFDPDSRKDHPQRFSMAVAFLQNSEYVNPEILEELQRQRCLPQDRLETYVKTSTGVGAFQSLSAWEGRIGQIEETVTSIVKGFDENFVKTSRRAFQAGKLRTVTPDPVAPKQPSRNKARPNQG